MKIQEYILAQLQDLNRSTVNLKPVNDEETVNTIFTILMSKKFRKFSVPEKNQKIIKDAIAKNILNKEPIKISWPFGGYKLWRLEETPEVDWAELFTLIYIAKWVKQVCAIYPHGVLFTFWVDEVVISKMNNIPQSDIDAYQTSFSNLLSFIEPYLPDNMSFGVFLERSQYENNEAFEAALADEIINLKKIREADPYPLSEDVIRSTKMNVRVTEEQSKDPLWLEKVDIMHNAYYNLQEKQTRIRPSYTKENIVAFTVFFEPNVIPIGSTKTSVAKFWVGVGALQKRGDGFIETILSPSQIERAEFEWQTIAIEGLKGKNFDKIRILK